MKIQIFATDSDGERFEIDDLYWFEENFVHSLDGSDSTWTFEIVVDGVSLTELQRRAALVDDIPPGT